MVSKKGLTFILPYSAQLSLDLRARLYLRARGIIERNLPYCKLKVILKSKCRLDTLFHKDSLQKKIRIIYPYTCSNCNVTYYRKNFRHFYTRVDQSSRIPSVSKRKGKKTRLNTSLIPERLNIWDLQSYRKAPQNR